MQKVAWYFRIASFFLKKKITHENISVCILFLLIVKYNDIEKELPKQKFLQWYDKKSVSISTKTLLLNSNQINTLIIKKE